MSLNIKNEHVHALAREAAAKTGKTQTGVIEEALERLLATYEADPDAGVAQRWTRIDQAIEQAHLAWMALPEAERPSFDEDALYDDSGLPA